MELIDKEESYKIMGASFEVYQEMGSGFLEPVYQECLGKEFKLQEIPFVALKPLELKYKGQVLNQKYVPDFVVFDKIIIELKAVKELAPEHAAQILNYLKATNHKLGILVNFGHHPQLEHKRYVR
jgi:GxxExxY protein